MGAIRHILSKVDKEETKLLELRQETARARAEAARNWLLATGSVAGFILVAALALIAQV